jgi:tetratricopeptide (TPR) repeat protein
VAAFHNNLGVIRESRKRMEDARRCFERAIEIEPVYSDALVNLAALLEESGHLEEAEARARQATQTSSNCPRAWLIPGNALRQRNLLEEALAACREAARQKPDYAEAYNNAGGVLTKLGRAQAAAVSFREAVRLRSDYAEAWRNLGAALRACGQPGEALGCYREALRLQPGDAEGHFNLSLTLLVTGHFREGWREFEWRWKTGTVPERLFDRPWWDGGALHGKRILLHAEQGLGDTIQFIRYARLIKDLGATVIVECQPPLVDLLRSARLADFQPLLELENSAFFSLQKGPQAAELESLPGGTSKSSTWAPKSATSAIRRRRSRTWPRGTPKTGH